MMALCGMGGVGAGDVKFVTAIGAWLGLPLTLYVMMAGCIAAGVYALVLLVSAPSLKETLLNIQLLWIRLVCLGRHIGSEDRVEAEVKRSDRRRRLIPFSAMMGIGLVATLVWLWSQSDGTFPHAQPRSSVEGSGTVSPENLPVHNQGTEPSHETRSNHGDGACPHPRLDHDRRGIRGLLLAVEPIERAARQSWNHVCQPRGDRHSGRRGRHFPTPISG